MKKQKALSLLLALVMVLGLLPAGVLAAEGGFLLTYEYPENLCDFTVTDGDDETKTYASGDIVPYDGTGSNPILVYGITNIADGYRIKRVTKGGSDWTESFVNGGYGFSASSIHSDTHVLIELETVPAELPTVKNVTLYLDTAGTQLAPENITYTASSTNDRLYGKAIYSDGVEYPVYYATGQWEFTTDGTTWKPTRTWGSNRFDFWPGWGGIDGTTGHPELDFLNASYDIRLCVQPTNLYTTGDPVYSNVIHVNGGASASGTTLTKLAAPTDLTWGKYYDNDAVLFDYNGMIAWKEDTTQPTHTTEITVYRKGENGAQDTEVFNSGWIVNQGSELWRNDWDFVNNRSPKLENGSYYFTLRAKGDGTTCADSDVATSGLWEYTAPAKRLAAPANPVWDWPTAKWDPSTDTNAGGYTVDWYYSADNAAASVNELKRLGGHVWWFAEGEKTAKDSFDEIWERFRKNGAGYYYFRVETISTDVEVAMNSEPSALSAAYQYDGSAISCTHSKTELRNAAAATCTAAGYTGDTVCTSCGEKVQTGETIPALGHNWDAGVVTKQPTEEEDGVMTYTCQRCGATKTESISRLEKQDVKFTVPSYSGTYGGPDVTNTATNLTSGGGALTYSSDNTSVATVNPASGRVTIQGAGTATITATAAEVPGKYAATSASYTLTINKAPLTVTANDKAIVYGEKVGGGSFTAAGFVKGEDESVLSGTAAYSSDYRQYGSVGEYAINVSGLTSGNYDITFVPGRLTVSKATSYTLSFDKLEQLAGNVTGVTVSVTPYDKTAVFSVEYQVGEDQWTTEVPQAAGTYPVMAALTGSENITVVSDQYTTATLVVKNDVTVNTGGEKPDVDVGVTVDKENGSANIEITDENLGKIVENADGNVSIDLGGVSGVDELVLPGNLVQELSKSDKAESLTVATEDASVTLSGTAMETVSSAIQDEGDAVTVRLKSVEKSELNAAQQAALKAIPNDAQVVDVSLVVTHPDGTKDILHELGGDVTITVSYDELPGVIDGGYVVACYVSDDGSITYLFAECNEAARTITFTTNHFSHYAVFVSDQLPVEVEDGSGSGLHQVGTTVTIRANSKSGYTFAGWQVVSGAVTLADASAAETTFTMPAELVKLKATYTQNSSGGGGGGGGGGASAYAVSAEKAEHGSVAVDPRNAAEGTVVTITVKPDAGYALETLTVTDKNGGKVELTQKDGAYTFVMPASKVVLKAVFAVRTAESVFEDVSRDAYYFEAVEWALREGVTTGTDAAHFSPDAVCTRAQAVTFLWRAAGSPAPESAEMPFADVPADAYYRDAVLWAVEKGVTKGTGDTAFSPDADCTRAQIVTFLWRAEGAEAAGRENPFVDAEDSAFYRDAVLWAVENGVTKGTGDTTFSPGADCTRAQIVTFLYRCMNK